MNKNVVRIILAVRNSFYDGTKSTRYNLEIRVMAMQEYSPSFYKSNSSQIIAIILAAKVELDIASLKWIPTLLEKEILSSLLKHKRMTARVSLLSLMIIWIIAIIIPCA